jgi:hypothetical protein
MKICHTCQQTYSDDVEFCPRDGAHLTAQARETEAQLAGQLCRRFRIVRRLGAGAMGTVFLAEQIAVGNRPVALKVLNRKLLDDPEFLLRFHNEAASTGRIHHSNVVTIYESGQADDGTPYIAMEFLEGKSLRQALARRGALPVPEVAEILQQAARGLSAAHKLGIIHRDLKPDNIFLTRGDEGELIVKVVDFGIAKLRESGTHTQTGMVLGTPAYMSFEQASGMRSDELDARSDVYSLGQPDAEFCKVGNKTRVVTEEAQMNKNRKVFLALFALMVVPVSALSQERWARSEKTDALRGTTSTRFTLEGKFLEAPQQGRTSSPTFVIDCDPNKWRVNRHQHGKLLDAYIVVGAVLDTVVDTHPSIVGERVVKGLDVQYRLDDGKVHSALWSYSTNFSGIFLSDPLGNLGDLKDEVLSGLLYSHKAIYKENASVPARKAVIQVPEYLGGNITMEFDFPDPTEVADSCGLFLYKKKQPSD